MGIMSRKKHGWRKRGEAPRLRPVNVPPPKPKLEGLTEKVVIKPPSSKPKVSVKPKPVVKLPAAVKPIQAKATAPKTNAETNLTATKPATVPKGATAGDSGKKLR